MTEVCDTPYGTWAATYRKLGFWPRPVFNGIDPRTGERLGKQCKITGWQLPDAEQPPGTLEGWDKNCATWNIGLLMGSEFPDGTRLGAFDNDDDLYVRLGRTLFNDPACARFGSKGIMYFVRYAPFAKKQKPLLKYKVNGKLVAEWFFERAQAIIPPSIHPSTGQPYRWIGTPLLEIDFRQLPIIEV